jgi:uncharacterized repeat protein (TIGR01451 family)
MALSLMLQVAPVSPAAAATYADLALTVVPPATTPGVGDTFSYQITVHNNGPDAASAVEARSGDFGYWIEFVSFSSADSGVTCALVSSPYPNTSIRCTLGDLSPDATSSVTILAKRMQPASIYVSSFAYLPDDPYSGNNSDYFTLAVDPDEASDLATAITGPTDPAVGTDYTFDTTVTNLGPKAAANVVVTISSGSDAFEFVSSSLSNCSYSSGERRVECFFASIPMGETRTMPVTVKRLSGNDYSHYAEASLQPDLDPRSSNNYGYYYVKGTQSAGSDFGITLQGPSQTPDVGSTFTLVAKAKNGGSLADVGHFSIDLPTGLTALSHLTANATCTSSYWGISCVSNSLSTDETASVTVTARRESAERQRISASVWTDANPDYNRDNDDAIVTLAAAPVRLTVVKSGVGGGTVTSSPAGISCGSTCASNFGYGAAVTLTVAPNASSAFAGWSGACSGLSPSCTVTMTGAQTVAAQFTNEFYTLTLRKTGRGRGTVHSRPPGIACGPSCEWNFLQNATVTLKARARSNSAFVRWGGACSGSKRTCTVTMSAAREVTAKFRRIA